MTSPPVAALDVPALARRVAALAPGGRRVLVGLAGAPGAGKSTLAAELTAALGPLAVTVPLDGFHLYASEIAGTNLAARRGAPDTFDASAYVALLRAIRSRPSEPLHAPAFSRVIEDPVPDAITIEPRVAYVVTEGNYLLLDDGPWAEVRALLDACWFVELADGTRRERLVARHVAAGKDPERARDWTHGPDEANARLIAKSRARADLVIRAV